MRWCRSLSHGGSEKKLLCRLLVSPPAAEGRETSSWFVLVIATTKVGSPGEPPRRFHLLCSFSLEVPHSGAGKAAGPRRSDHLREVPPASVLTLQVEEKKSSCLQGQPGQEVRTQLASVVANYC